MLWMLSGTVLHFRSDHVAVKGPFAMRYALFLVASFMVAALVHSAQADILPPYPEYQIGVGLDEAQPYIRISAVMPGSPAAAAGVKVDDQVIAINGTYTKGGAPAYFMARVINKGPQNSVAKLVILRGGREVLLFEIKRTMKLR